jgi:hypothetical protein
MAAAGTSFVIHSRTCMFCAISLFVQFLSKAPLVVQIIKTEHLRSSHRRHTPKHGSRNHRVIDDQPIMLAIAQYHSRQPISSPPNLLCELCQFVLWKLMAIGAI